MASGSINALRSDSSMLISRHFDGVAAAAEGPGLTAHRPSSAGNDVVVDKLINGGIFLKHAVGSGQPHYRAVWCSPDLQTVSWGELDKTKASGSIKVSELTSVTIGDQSPAFQKQKAKRPVNPALCFSISGKDRTLDLECVSQTDRDLWVLAFKFLMQQRGDKGATPSTSVAAVDAEERKKLSPAVLADQVALLTDRLQESQSRIERLERELKRAKGGSTDALDTVAADGAKEASPIHSQLYEQKRQEELNYLKNALQQSRAHERTLEQSHRELELEADRLKAELHRVKAASASASGGTGSADAAEALRRLTEEAAQLRNELHLAHVRESVRQFSPPPDTQTTHSAGHVVVLQKLSGQFSEYVRGLDELQVPLSAVLRALHEQGDPGLGRDFESDEEEDEDEDSEARSARLKARDPAFVAEKHLSGFVRGTGTLALNQKLLRVRANSSPLSGAAVSNETLSVVEALDRLEDAVIDAAQTLSRAHARALLFKLLATVTLTRCAGDAYAALKWMVGHPELALICADNARYSSIAFTIDQSGIALSTMHHYVLCDPTRVSEGVLASTLVFCTAQMRQKISFRGEELVPPLISLTFSGSREDPKARSALAPSPDAAAHRRQPSPIAPPANPSPRTPTASSSAPAPAPAPSASPARPAAGPSVSQGSPGGPPAPSAADDRDLYAVRAAEHARISKAQDPSEDAASQRNGQWFVIDNLWLNSWKQFVQGGPRPGPITNARLLGAKGPLPGLKAAVDYRVLNGATWRALLDLYGGGPELSRPTRSLY